MTVNAKTTMISRSALALSLLLVLASVLSINYWAVNFPNSDDYTAIVGPLIKVREAPDLSHKLAPILEPHTQHYQILLRLVAWCTTLVNGGVQFWALILLGSLFLVPMTLLLATQAGTGWALVAVCLLICQPQYAEATQWATNAVPYLWVNVFAIAAFYWASSSGAATSIGMTVAATAAVLSWGNGILVPALLLLSPSVRNRSRVLFVLAVLILGVVLIFSNPNTHHSEIFSLDAIWQIILYFVRILGCSFGFFSSAGSLLIGSGLLSLWVFFALQCFAKERSRCVRPLLLFELFLIGSCFLCALFRFTEGPETAFTTGRYTLQSVLLVACISIRCFELDLHERASRGFRVVLLLVAIGWWGFAYKSYYGNYRLRAELLTDSKVRWSCVRSGLAGLGWADLDPIQSRAEELGLLQREAVRCEDWFHKPLESQFSSDKSEPAVVRIEYALRRDWYFQISGYGFRPQDDRWDGRYQLVLKNEQHRFVLPLQPRLRPDVTYHVWLHREALAAHSSTYDTSGFSGFVDVADFPAGSYQLFLLLQSGGRTTWSPLPQTLSVN